MATHKKTGLQISRRQVHAAHLAPRPPHALHRVPGTARTGRHLRPRPLRGHPQRRRRHLYTPYCHAEASQIRLAHGLLPRRLAGQAPKGSASRGCQVEGTRLDKEG